MKENLDKELKIMTIVAFVFALGFFVTANRLIPYLILSFIFLGISLSFSLRNNLRASGNILIFILTIYNVASLAYGVQYLRKLDNLGPIPYLFKPFMVSNKISYYIGAVLVYTIVMIFVYKLSGANYGKEE